MSDKIALLVEIIFSDTGKNIEKRQSSKCVESIHRLQTAHGK